MTIVCIPDGSYGFQQTLGDFGSRWRVVDKAKAFHSLEQHQHCHLSDAETAYQVLHKLAKPFPLKDFIADTRWVLCNGGVPSVDPTALHRQDRSTETAS